MQNINTPLQNARIWQQQDIHLGLDNMKELLNRLGNPQEKLSVIHVAGTNGKGSQIAMLKAILVESGYYVGAYTSPAVFSKYEIIQLDNQYITQDEYEEYKKEIDQAARLQGMETGEEPSPFERETAMAFLYFYRKCCDIVLLETGMGGDLDATNVVKFPLCSVITSISMDHMAFLGDSLWEIAHKKAGIIKEKCPVSIGVQEPLTEQILTSRAEEKKAPCRIARKDRIGGICRREDGFCFRYRTEDGFEYCDLCLPFHSTYQLENAIQVIETVNLLKPVLKKITCQTVAAGLLKARWAGRFERLRQKPDFYIDGAHNTAAAVQLSNTIFQLQKLKSQESKGKVIYIVGMLRDKEWKKVLDIMLRGQHEQIWIPVTIPHSRGLEASQLCEYIQNCTKTYGKCSGVYSAPDIKSSVGLALKKANPEDLIVAFGSLSFLDAIKRQCISLGNI